MTPLEKDILLRKSNRIRQNLAALQEIAEKGIDSYRRNFLHKKAAERLLQEIVEAAIDINLHVLASEHSKQPEDYYESFILMGEMGMLPEELAKRLAPAAGLRNRLVHQYDDLDDAIVFDSINESLIVMPKFLEAIAKV
ncbi:MAG: DUF86 domain-containing protein [Deltaproteobacteria bacterium]|nr:DUF86 domain-containing protein [Deltaproteobacteria bacterium]